MALDADHDWIYDVIGYLIKLRIIWTTSQQKKNPGPLKDTFYLIPLLLTFQGDVVIGNQDVLFPFCQMDMVQVHAFPCSNVLYEANNVIFLSIQFISHRIQLFFKDEISVFKNGNDKVQFIFLNSSPLRKYYLLIILR